MDTHGTITFVKQTVKTGGFSTNAVELAITQFSLVDLTYQPSFNPSSRSYSVYGLTIHHNRSYFNNYHLDWLLTIKKIKTSDPDFYQTSIAQLSDLLR